MPDAASFKGRVAPDWCPGCGDYSVLAAMLAALAETGLEPHQVMVISGIGCSSNLPGFLSTYGMHTLHGRALAVASGAWFANHAMKTIVVGGDGDGYGIGMGHFIHAMRRNLDITYVVMNNGIYGLTTGQASPTSPRGMKTKTTPLGSIERPVNPVGLALCSRATYVARGASSDTKHLAGLIAGGLRHKGFALIDVFSPCVSFNHLQTYEWLRKSVYKLEDQGHDPTDPAKAREKAAEWGERIPLGLFWRTERPTYADQDEVLKDGPVFGRRTALNQEEKAALLEGFR